MNVRGDLAGLILGLAAVSGAGCAMVSRTAVSAPGTPPMSARAPALERWCTAPGAPATEGPQGVSGPLSELSGRFRESHQRARAQACRRLASHRLVIRYAFGTIEARWNGEDLGPPVSLFTPHVHALKAVSHAVFLAALLFDEPPGAARDEHLGAALRTIEAVRLNLDNPSTPEAKLFSPHEIPGQVRILTLTSAALRALRQGRSSERERRHYFTAVRPLVHDDVRSASVAVLTLLHQTVEGYKHQVEAKDPGAWASLVVVATVAHQARAREIAIQYFERRLDEQASEGASGEDHLVVLEGQPAPADQRGGLAAHEVDRRFAVPIFGDPNRLQSDVLADSGGLLDRLVPARVGQGRRDNQAAIPARRGGGIASWRGGGDPRATSQRGAVR
jgi:hypothetical protein